MRRTDLTGADLTNASLNRADLTEAKGAGTEQLLAWDVIDPHNVHQPRERLSLCWSFALQEVLAVDAVDVLPTLP